VGLLIGGLSMFYYGFLISKFPPEVRVWSIFFQAIFFLFHIWISILPITRYFNMKWRTFWIVLTLLILFMGILMGFVRHGHLVHERNRIKAIHEISPILLPQLPQDWNRISLAPGSGRDDYVTATYERAGSQTQLSLYESVRVVQRERRCNRATIGWYEPSRLLDVCQEISLGDHGAIYYEERELNLHVLVWDKEGTHIRMSVSGLDRGEDSKDFLIGVAKSLRRLDLDEI
jgi:hypothetical protein